MRVAVMVISLLAMLLLFLQSCTIFATGEISGSEDASQGGAVGIVMAFLFILGGAFAIGKPRISLGMFGFAAFLGFAAGSTTNFSDLTIWGTGALILAVMSYLGLREMRAKQAAPATQEPRADAG